MKKLMMIALVALSATAQANPMCLQAIYKMVNPKTNKMVHARNSCERNDLEKKGYILAGDLDVNANQPKCADEAVKAAVSKNFKSFGASTSSCGIKALNIADHLETYMVCTSDETDPMEYIVVMQTAKSNSKGDIVKRCVPSFVGNSNDAKTPNFESEEGLLKSIECSIDNGDNKLICK